MFFLQRIQYLLRTVIVTVITQPNIAFLLSRKSVYPDHVDKG